MNIVKTIVIDKKRLHLRQNFSVIYEDVSETEVIFIKIIDQRGNFGLGSTACDTHVTGEKIDDVLKILKLRLTKIFFDIPFQSWYQYHEKIQKVFSSSLAAQFGVEAAVLDLFSKINGIALPVFFGGYRTSADLIYSVGIKGIEETRGEVLLKLEEGFKIIKLKIGGDLGDDIKKIRMIRKIMPSRNKMTLDANRGYTFKEAKQLFKAINPLNISLIEEPLVKNNLHRLGELKLAAKIPIIADESAVTVNSAIDILLSSAWDGLNVKLINCGGPINFLKIFYLAKALKKITMIGCTYESNIAMTAGANLALGLPVDYIDLDSGHLDFIDDPTVGGAEAKAGKIKIEKPLTLPGY